MSTAVQLKRKGFAVTARTDSWWLQSAFVIFGLGTFLVYGTWAAWQGNYYWYSGGTEGFGGYLSPFYSPLLFIKEGVEGSAPVWHAWFGSWPAWLFDFAWLPASPSWLILAFPGIFRFTCYYYRKSYYRAFAASPPACAVGAISQNPYKGETGFLTFQNLHRYTMYIVVVYVIIFFYDATLAFFNDGVFGVGVGSVVLLINPLLLGAYVFGCHSFRHLIGGKSDCMSCSKTQLGTWKKVSWLNERHQLFAWASMIWVMVGDIYVRLVSMGIINDWNTWGI